MEPDTIDPPSSPTTYIGYQYDQSVPDDTEQQENEENEEEEHS